MILRNPQCVIAVGGFDDCITFRSKEFPRRLPQCRLIFDQLYRFTATDALCNRLENWYLIGLLLDRGQIDFEGCS